MMSDSDEDRNLPSADECERRCQEFATVTGTDTALAMFYLQDRDWDLQRSINAFFEENGGQPPQAASAASGKNDQKTKSGSAAATEQNNDSQRENKRIRIITWNIDGLDQGNLKTRTTAVCDTINVEKPDVVYLQEVIPATLEILETLCPQYQIIPGDRENYFTAIMLLSTSVTLETHKITPFFSSRMGRNLITVKAKVKGVEMQLMTSHLESTASSADERKKQLRTALSEMAKAAASKTVLFGGDLNLRDKEVQEIGGLPDGILDLWEATGRRQEAKFTWDLRRNDNLEWNRKFRPQCRFDRLYMKHGQKRQLRPVYFELVGIERIKSCRRFPSDHWGLLAHLDIVR